jgi:hypothetical protein
MFVSMLNYAMLELDDMCVMKILGSKFVCLQS